MIVSFIEEKKPHNDILLDDVLMYDIPRVSDTITFPINEGGKKYKVTGVDFLIKDKKQELIRIWVQELK